VDGLRAGEVREVDGKRKAGRQPRQARDEVAQHGGHGDHEEVGAPKYEEPENGLVDALDRAHHVLQAEDALHKEEEPGAQRAEQLHHEEDRGRAVNFRAGVADQGG